MTVLELFGQNCEHCKAHQQLKHSFINQTYLNATPLTAAFDWVLYLN